MKKKFWKKFALILLIIILVLVTLWRVLFLINFQTEEGPYFGVTFSQKQAQNLRLSWKEVYKAALAELGVQKLRLIAYWDLVEKEQNKYDFSDLDFQMDEAEKHQAEVILVVGRRVPRWPECHQPAWLSALAKDEQELALLSYLEAIVKHFKDHPALKMWQVENEPFLKMFGYCPPRNKGLLIKEIALVGKIDPKHPIMVTDSGELATWLRTRHLAEYLGTTAYRVVYNPWIGYLDYGRLIPPAYYRLKAKIIQKPVDKIIVSELQAEPWTPGDLINVSLSEQAKSMDIKRFNQTIIFARRLGFGEVYFWGVEWWYWLKEQGESVFWEKAKDLF